MVNIGERIKRLRTECDWSQQDLAQRLEVSKQAISNWERNAAKPDLNQLVALAEVFRVSADHLLGLEEGPHFIHPQGSIKSRTKHWDWIFQKSYDLIDVLESKYRFTLDGRILTAEKLSYFTEMIKTSAALLNKTQEQHHEEINELKAEIARLKGRNASNDDTDQLSLF